MRFLPESNRSSIRRPQLGRGRGINGLPAPRWAFWCSFSKPLWDASAARKKSRRPSLGPVRTFGISSLFASVCLTRLQSRMWHSCRDGDKSSSPTFWINCFEARYRSVSIIPRPINHCDCLAQLRTSKRRATGLAMRSRNHGLRCFLATVSLPQLVSVRHTLFANSGLTCPCRQPLVMTWLVGAHDPFSASDLATSRAK